MFLKDIFKFHLYIKFIHPSHNFYLSGTFSFNIIMKIIWSFCFNRTSCDHTDVKYFLLSVQSIRLRQNFGVDKQHYYNTTQHTHSLCHDVSLENAKSCKVFVQNEMKPQTHTVQNVKVLIIRTVLYYGMLDNICITVVTNITRSAQECIW